MYEVFPFEIPLFALCTVWLPCGFWRFAFAINDGEIGSEKVADTDVRKDWAGKEGLFGQAGVSLECTDSVMYMVPLEMMMVMKQSSSPFLLLLPNKVVTCLV